MTSIRRILEIITIAALTLAVTSACSDSMPDIPDYTVVGEPVAVSFPISVPGLETATRGDLSDNQLNRIETLWIRTYSANDGSATSDWLKVEEDYQLGVIEPESLNSVTLNTLSGPSYIVAVANVDNPAVTRGESGAITESTLRNLLEKADTWADFLSIAVPSPSDQTQVNAPQVNSLPMAGCFSDLIVGGEHPEPTGLSYWQDADFRQYMIPAYGQVTKLTGAIHLRRLISNITFRFISGDENMELEVNSYQVMSAPKYSWLYERPTDPGKGLVSNFEDLATSAQDAREYYADVPQFGSQFIREETDDKGTWQTFDFWQAENKHTGNCTKYADRGKYTEKDGVTLFTSLTGDTWTPNNQASYVLVDCSVDYGDHDLLVNDKGEIVEDGEPVKRSGIATYIIHLGAIGGAPDDFNSYRNVDYTYNVTVYGLDDIRVDAFATTDTGEIYHNEEGLVVDLNARAIDIDCHYGVFNINLSAVELSENFGFIITTYDNGEQIIVSEGNPRNEAGEIFSDAAKTKKIDPKYYNWIELRPTTGANVLAEYKPRFGEHNDGRTFLLTDLYTKDGKLHIPNDDCLSAEGYYTVFVNEYTYEPMFGDPDYGLETGLAADGRPNWMHYVNQNPRRFYIKVSYHVSPDGNSVYARSKYAVEQQSLMTYYSQINVDPDGTSIGVERENETFGLNLRHYNNGGGNSLTNGRWNAAQYLSTGGKDDYNNKTENYNGQNPWGSVSVNRPNEEQRSTWSHFLEMSEPLEVPGVTDKMRLQGGPAIKDRTIANGNPHKLRKIKTDTDSKDPNFTDPQPDRNYNIRAMSALVNRNRDNNGNGTIDAEELRWYIPAITRYSGMTLGENAMPQKLMMFDEIKQLLYVNASNNGFSSSPGRIDNCFYSRYMYLASNYAPKANGNNDNNVLWAMEGTSMSKYAQLTDWSTNKADMPLNPWQIRCVRNLGSDLRTVVREDKVSLPFIHISGSRTLSMNYFNLAAIRTYQLTGNGPDNPDFMPIHTINSPYNSVYAAFEYAPNDIIVPNEYRPTYSDYQNHYFDKFRDYIGTNPCGNAGFNGSGWRVPNQIELTMMFNSGILIGDGNWLTCTVDYFDRKDGKGSDAISHKLYMGATSGKTLLLSWDNYAGYNLRVRCIRDVNR